VPRPAPEERATVPIDPVLVLLVIAVLANVVTVGIIILAPRMAGSGTPDDAAGAGGSLPAAVRMAAVTGRPAPDLFADGVPQRTYDRVVRIAAWVYLLAVAAVVAVSGLWPDTEAAIFVLLAIAAVFILIVHDLLPADALGSAKFVVEGSVGITFAALLVLLTGQEASPFFFSFPLIVAGAALVVSPGVTVALAAAASAGYLFAVLLPVDSEPLEPVAIATIGINLSALLLLTYVAMVIAREQRRSREAAIRLSTVDTLTGLFNRAFLFAAVDREIARSNRSGRGFCLLMMDLDGLKTVNDRHGHHVGDRLLRGVGDQIRTGVRRIDTPARYGGDEFVVLCPETDPTGAYILAEKIRRGIAELVVDAPGELIRPSVSIGAVAFPDDGTTADSLLIRADEAMYASKRGGKDRVTSAGPPGGMGGADAGWPIPVGPEREMPGGPSFESLVRPAPIGRRSRPGPV
jgi:diguanylate cyclase (GGDEF)-like protein